MALLIQPMALEVVAVLALLEMQGWLMAVAEAARELFLLLQVPLFNTPVVAVVVQPTIQEPQVLSAPLWAALAEVMAGFRITHLLTEMLRPL
jgi:hypothetical protein